jgi:hypothetical protein
MIAPQIPPLILCVPCELSPDHDKKNSYSTWEKILCPDCSREMWLGQRSRALTLVRRDIKAVCMLCAIERYGIKSSDPIVQLSDHIPPIL